MRPNAHQAGPTAGSALARVLRPFQEFAKIEAAGGILLLAATVVAVAWANSPWGAGYTQLWQTRCSVGVGSFALSKPLLLWINDGLMAVFFLVVGLEIKREIVVGELSSPRQAALPIAAAVGGMVMPAAIYAALNVGRPGAVGWAVPMATDIAFALGVLALLGDRVPSGLKVFLAALAIVDDLGAVLVIAVFYTGEIHWSYLAWGALIVAALAVANRSGVRSPLAYLVLGAALWFTFLKSGVHATIAGVLLALFIPARATLSTAAFRQRAGSLLEQLDAGGTGDDRLVLSHDQLSLVQALEDACERVETPLQRLEHALHPWVGFVIMPVFALANAGVTVGGALGPALADRVSLGVLLGLVVGKPVGIALASRLVVRAGLAELPDNVGWRHVYGAGCLAGIGFTMSLFIAGLGFAGTAMLTAAKVGIVAASVVAGVGGWLVLPRGDAEGDSSPVEA